MTQRTSTEIAADLADYRAARSALIKGERVKDVWRDGRRVTYAEISAEDVNKAIAQLEGEYEQAILVEAGKPRRSAIGVGYA